MTLQWPTYTLPSKNMNTRKFLKLSALAVLGGAINPIGSAPAIYAASPKRLFLVAAYKEAEQEWELKLSTGFQLVTKGCLLCELKSGRRQWYRCDGFETEVQILVIEVAEKDLPWAKEI